MRQIPALVGSLLYFLIIGLAAAIFAILVSSWVIWEMPTLGISEIWTPFTRAMLASSATLWLYRVIKEYFPNLI